MGGHTVSYWYAEQSPELVCVLWLWPASPISSSPIPLTCFSPATVFLSEHRKYLALPQNCCSARLCLLPGKPFSFFSTWLISTQPSDFRSTVHSPRQPHNSQNTIYLFTVGMISGALLHLTVLFLDWYLPPPLASHFHEQGAMSISFIPGMSLVPGTVLAQNGSSPNICGACEHKNHKYVLC